MNSTEWVTNLVCGSQRLVVGKPQNKNIGYLATNIILSYYYSTGFGDRKVSARDPPAVNFINVKHANFLYEHCFFYVHITRENNVCTKNLYR